MSDDHPTRDSMSHEEATVFNMWEIAAIAEWPQGYQGYPPSEVLLLGLLLAMACASLCP
jgi:hypothetical protein